MSSTGWVILVTVVAVLVALFLRDILRGHGKIYKPRDLLVSWVAYAVPGLISIAAGIAALFITDPNGFIALSITQYFGFLAVAFCILVFGLRLQKLRKR